MAWHHDKPNDPMIKVRIAAGAGKGLLGATFCLSEQLLKMRACGVLPQL
jgi:hypothetical protein